MGTKNLQEILSKLRIEKLNPMQEEAGKVIRNNPNTILLSPTGTGKTLAFLLPIIAELKLDLHEVQLLILVPSRELAIQIEQVTREMGTGFKTNAVYGGRVFSQDKLDLKTKPAILIGTPGRVADHLRRGTFSTAHLKTLVLDEFDKSLEVGFEEQMTEIIEQLTNIRKRVLTSATKNLDIPDFVGIENASTLNYLNEGVPDLSIQTILSPQKDKLPALASALKKMEGQPGIIFCNFRDSIERVSDYLLEQGIPHGQFHGGMEQKDRERSLIKFRNGTHQLLLATDLAARGIDVPEIKFIIHYHLPMKKEEFTHRNGRTARMKSDGTAYVLQWEKEELPDFIPNTEVVELSDLTSTTATSWTTLMVSGGRRDKISKGDLAGLFFKQGKLKKEHLGMIELKPDCAFVAVHSSKVKQVIQLIDNTRLKKRKVRISEV